MAHEQYKKLGSNLLFITIGNFASRILSFLLIPLYTSVLTTEEYGVADLVSTTVSLLFPIFTAVVCEAMMRYALGKEYDYDKIWNAGLWVWGVGFILFLALSPLINLVPSLSPQWIYLILYYFSYSLNFNASYFARGIEKVKLYAFAGIMQTVFTIGLNLLFLLVLKIGLKGYLLAFILANTFTAVLLVIGTRAYKYSIKKPDMALTKELLAFSIPLIPNQIGWWANKSADKFFLLAMCNSSLVGVYSVAHKIPSILYVLVSIFSSAWRISAMDQFGSEENRKFFSNVYDKFMTVSFVCASAIIVINKIVARFLYAKEFYAAHVYVPVLVLAVLFNGLGEYLSSIYITYKKTKPLMVTTMIGVLINVVLNALLIPIFGGIGAAIATMAGFAGLWVVRSIDSRKIMKLEFKLLTTVMCIVLLFAQTAIWIFEVPLAFYINLIIFAAIVFLRRDIVIILKERIIKVIHGKRRVKNGGDA